MGGKKMSLKAIVRGERIEQLAQIARNRGWLNMAEVDHVVAGRVNGQPQLRVYAQDENSARHLLDTFERNIDGVRTQVVLTRPGMH